MKTALKIEGLSKEYKNGSGKKVAVLEDLNLAVNQGEVFGLLGPNGAGKTTTLKLLTGLAVPTRGRAFILEKEVSCQEVRNLIGFLPENPRFHHYLSAEECLKFYGRLFPIPAAVLSDRIDFLLQMVNLEKDRKSRIDKFSQGMRQRIGIAQALINDPLVVFFDEPMTGLDPLGREMVRQIIVKLKEEGKTVFFSSHILSDAEHLCDRIGILAGGKLKKEGTISNFISENKENLQEAILSYFR